jgi:hypothetical protein
VAKPAREALGNLETRGLLEPDPDDDGPGANAEHDD